MVTKRENNNNNNNDDDVIYLNNASTCILSPKVQLAGIDAIRRPPWESTSSASVLEDQTAIRKLFSKIIGVGASSTTDDDDDDVSRTDICLVPSTAFALTMAAENLARLLKQQTAKSNNSTIIQHVLLLQDQFASAVYPFQHLCEVYDNIKIEVVPYPNEVRKKNNNNKKNKNTNVVTWTSLVLDHLKDETKEYLAVCLPPLHWSDGTVLNLKKIGQVCKGRNIPFLVDATQAVGILHPPVNVQEYNCTMLVCSMHKWLRCPMGMAFVYVNKEVQKTWLPLDQHARSRNHHGQEGGNDWDAPKHEMNPTTGYYTPEFVKDARKLDSGGRPNAQLLPIVRIALEELILMEEVDDTESAQKQLKKLMLPLLDWAEKRGWYDYNSSNSNNNNNDDERCYHIVGLRPKELSVQTMLMIAKRLQQDYRIYIAVKCGAFRISPYLNNTAEDVNCLIKAFEQILF